MKKFWRSNKSILLFVTLMLVFRSAIADWSDVPTGSMKPTILEGDRVFVNKMAYDIRLPFSHISLLKLDDPKTNEIIIFDSKVADKRLIKRVIGVPGDIVAMQNNRLSINGKSVSYQVDTQFNDKTYQIEQINEISHLVTTSRVPSKLANFSAVEVPQGHYLVLGDNRDKSADSRVIGFVPRHEIVGRSQYVVLSLDYKKWLPRAERFFHEL